MYPILFELGPIRIFSYGTMLALGFWISLWLAQRRSNQAGVNPDLVSETALVALLAGIAGARLGYVLAHPRFFIENPLQVFALWQGGLVVYGGLFLGGLACWLWIRRRGAPVWKTADLMVTYLPIGQAVGRIGCFLNGCCFGSPSCVPWAVVYPPDSFAAERYGQGQPVHPVQLYDALGLCGVFLVLTTVLGRKRFDGQVTAAYVGCYAVSRFFTEAFRGDTPLFFGLTFAQCLSLLSVVAGAWLYFAFRRAAGTPARS